MKHKNHPKKSKHEKKKHRKSKHSEYDSNASETEQEWVEKTVPQSTMKEFNVEKSEALKREDWMDIKNVFPCVFNDKPTKSQNLDKNDKPDLDKLGQSDRELNPYWKDGGTGLPKEDSIKTEHIMDVNWLKKSFQRAKEQAESENRSLEEIAAERWGSLEAIQCMISTAENASRRIKSEYKNQSIRDSEKYRISIDSHHSKYSNRNDYYKKYDSTQYNCHKKDKFRKPMSDDYFDNSVDKKNLSGKKNWQKHKTSKEIEPILSQSSSDASVSINISNDCTSKLQATVIEILTEAEMNKLGAKIAKAEIMGDTVLADKLKLELRNARKVAKEQGSEKVQNVILTRTDAKGVARPLEPRSQLVDSSRNDKRKNGETHVSRKKVRHYFDDDKYSLQQLFQKEKGRSTYEDDAAFVKIASNKLNHMNMDEIFEEDISRVKSDTKQRDKERLLAIKEHKQLSKSLDNCHWCTDSKYMLKHMIVTMDSEICLSLPQYTSLTIGQCIITPINHVACQLQLDENVWAKLKMYKQALYKMFKDQNQYPVFYEIYKNGNKFSHMQLECVPLPNEVGELAPMYFKKALLECETEWAMNKKIVDLTDKDVRQAIPNGLSYFMVEFETNKGYAHVIEDERMFPKNFAAEIIGGMLDLDHDMWRKPKKENRDQQHEKVLQFSDIWKKYEVELNSCK